MDNLSDYIPLIIIIGSIIYSAVKGFSKKEPEADSRQQTSQQPAPRPVARPTVAQPVLKPNPSMAAERVELKTQRVPLAESPATHRDEPILLVDDEGPATPVLDLSNLDEVKKAFIYSEIFNRKEQ